MVFIPVIVEEILCVYISPSAVLIIPHRRIDTQSHRDSVIGDVYRKICESHHVHGEKIVFFFVLQNLSGALPVWCIAISLYRADQTIPLIRRVAKPGIYTVLAYHTTLSLSHIPSYHYLGCLV